MTIRLCPNRNCRRFTAFKICKVCGKETEEWKDGAKGPDEVVGEVVHIVAVQSAQEDTGLEAAPDQ